MTAGATITSTTVLTPEQAAATLRLVEKAAEWDGYEALNEAALLHLRHQRAGVVHVLAVQPVETDPSAPLGTSAGEKEPVRLVGYAQLDYEQPPDSAQPISTGQLVVSPAQRHAGIGAALLRELSAQTPSRLRIWALGNSAAAQALAARGGLVPARELLIMTRPLTGELPEVTPPAGVSLRTFVVGQDETEWLGLNARAFASHPEQGQLTRADLDERMAEPWFDPDGFFLAEREPTEVGTGATADTGVSMVGFHWTKQHPDRLGEVYVLGVDPSAGGGGLGRALLSRGLRHLRDRGNESVQLYVEADHERAVRLYAGYGFTESSRDVMYAQP